MNLSYVLHEAGWATATIEHEGRHRVMRVSWMNDAVLRMINAAIGMKNGAQEVRFGFTDEPGEHECVVTQTEPGRIRVRLFWYEVWMPPGRDTGAEVFACETSRKEFCQTIFDCGKQLLDEHGEDGYKARWVAHEFPTEAFETLSRLLYPPRQT
jgi:hypothetical protein